MRSVESNFVCSQCFLEDKTLSNSAKEHLQRHTVSKPPKARQIMIRQVIERDGKPPTLREGVNANKWHKLHERKVLERDREQRFKNTHFENFTFRTLDDATSVNFFGMQKYQIAHIFQNYVSANLRDGYKIKKENKFLIFMFYLRHESNECYSEHII